MVATSLTGWTRVQVTDKDGDDADKKDEAIVPTDLNIITDDDLRDIFDKLPPNVLFTMITDCCHSGSMLDHPEQQIAGDKAQGTAVAADMGAAAVWPPSCHLLAVHLPPLSACCHLLAAHTVCCPLHRHACAPALCLPVPSCSAELVPVARRHLP
jgi:Caspase domain